MLKVSLITTVFNEARGIEAFAESINRQRVLPDEVIIVDGGSSDGTVDLLRQALRKDIEAKVVVDRTCSRACTRGPIARGRNAAIRLASHEHVLVTDAGCELSPGWVEQMKATFERHACDVVAGWYRPKAGNAFQAYIADVFCPAVEKIDPKSFLPSSRSIAFTKSAWSKAGGYPEDSYTAEDTVFDLRLYASASKVVFNREAWVSWELPATFSELAKKLKQYGEGEGLQGIFAARYAGRALFLLLAPASTMYLVARRKKLITFGFYWFQLLGYVKGSSRRFLDRRGGSPRAE